MTLGTATVTRNPLCVETAFLVWKFRLYRNGGHFLIVGETGSFERDSELPGDGFVGVARGDQAQYLAISARQSARASCGGPLPVPASAGYGAVAEKLQDTRALNYGI